jgi:tetratricopeptide repeat protein 8
VFLFFVSPVQTLASQAFRVCLSHNASHAEALTNMALLDLRAGQLDAARAGFETATRLAPRTVEAWWNLALLQYKTGELEGAHAAVAQVLGIDAEHANAKKLKRTISTMFLGF